MSNRLFVGSILAAMLLMLAALPLQAQNATLTGVVTAGATGQLLPNVSVYLDGTGYGTITGPNGRYTISNVVPGTYTVVAQTLGYADARRTNTVLERGATVTVDFTLQMQVLSMQEVVVTGVADPTEGVRVPFTVNRVSREDLPVTATDVIKTLQGRVPGIRTAAASGEPGSGIYVRLRSRLSTHADTQPLIVVDGVIQASNAVDLDPNDIETMEVVKGAAASSLYGARAQSGVIQITTRRGRNVQINTTRFIARSEYGFNMVGKMPTINMSHPYLQNEAGQWLDQAGNVVARAERVLQPSRMMDQPYRTQTYDNFGQVFDPGSSTTNTFSIARNTEATNFFFSVGDFREAGVLPELSDGFQRQNLRLNLDHRLRDNLTMAVTSYYSRSDRDNLVNDHPNSQNRGGNIFWNLRFMAPDLNIREKDEDGDYKIHLDSPMRGTNPLYGADVIDSRRFRSRLQGAVSLRYNPLNWVSFEAMVGLDRMDQDEFTYYPKPFKTVSPSDVNDGEYSRSLTLEQGINAMFETALLRTFGDLTSRLRLRYNLERDDNLLTSSRSQKFRVVDIRSLSNGYTTWSQSSEQAIRSESVLAALGLDHGGRYIMDALVRRDGSSLFGPDSRWNTYYRTALAWRMAEEEWWPFPDVLTEFKPRFSRGTAGARPDYFWRYETWTVGATGPSMGQLGNKALRPETSTETDYGLDFIIKDRFSLGVSYINTEVKDQLIPIPLPKMFGYTSQWQNAGTVRSKAYEATFEALFVTRPDFSWRSGLVLDRSRSTLHDWPRGCYRQQYRYRCEGESFGNMYGTLFLSKGSQLKEYWGGRFAPYADQFQINDDGYLVPVGTNATWRDGISKGLWGTTVNIDGQDFRWGIPFTMRNAEGLWYAAEMGSTDPTVNMGWTNNIQWRGLQFFALWYGSLGSDIYSETRQWPFARYLAPEMDQRGVPDDRKKPVDYHIALYDSYSWNSHFVDDGSYIKLGQASVGYRFSQSQLARVRGGFGLSSLSLELIGRNLLIFTNFSEYDPEVGDQRSSGGPTETPLDAFRYPLFRTVTLGVTIEF